MSNPEREMTGNEEFIAEVQRFLGIKVTGQMSAATRDAWLDAAGQIEALRRLRDGIEVALLDYNDKRRGQL